MAKLSTLPKALANVCQHPDCPDWLADAICEAVNIHAAAETRTATWFAAMLESSSAVRQPADILDATVLHNGGGQ